MPYLDHWPRWAILWYRFTYAMFYTAIATAGTIGLTWPGGVALNGGPLVLTRVGGILITLPALVALVAHLSQRWRLELMVIWIINLGATLYITVVLILAGPQRFWLMFACFITACMAAISVRGITLLVFERKTRSAKEGQRLIYHRRRRYQW